MKKYIKRKEDVSISIQEDAQNPLIDVEDHNNDICIETLISLNSIIRNLSSDSRLW